MNFAWITWLLVGVATATAADLAPAVGAGVVVGVHPQPRAGLCDFAAQAAKLQAQPMDQDPVFRPPSPQAKGALGVVRKRLMQGEAAAQEDLRTLLAGPEGATLARLAIQDGDPKVQLAAVRAATPQAQNHPRLFAFLPTLDTKTAAELALAIVDFDFATGCDAPVLFALDGLGHPAASVVQALIDKVGALAATHRDAAPVDRLVAWLMRREGSAPLRARAVRVLGQRGLLNLATTWQKLAGDSAPEVAGEAWSAWARVAPGQVQVALAAGGLADPRPLLQWGALRAAADACALDPARCEKLVRPLLASKAQLADPVTGSSVRIGAVAAQVLAYWGVAP